MAFKKAVKSQSKLRAAMFGPSGSGKTFSALAIATGMGGKIALIDSERSSASKYADRFNFDQQDLAEKDIDEYVEKINEAAGAGYEVLIIDSLSHAWQMLLDSVEKLANAKYRGNTWSAWSEGTPEQRKLVNAIVNYPGHVIVTMRSKTVWQAGTNDKGKTAPTRIGLAPEQGKGLEYEFDILFEISPEHLAHIIKDRTGKFQDKIIEKPGKEFGQQLVAWLNEGAAPPPPPAPSPRQQCTERMQELKNIMLTQTGDGSRIFSDGEYQGVKTFLESLTGKPDDKRLEEINRLLDNHEIKLRERLDQLTQLRTDTPKTESSPNPEPGKEGFSGQYQKYLEEKQKAGKTGTAPETAMYGTKEPPEDDGFEDDLPFGPGEEKTAPKEAELGIF
jgi:hypothetical protein